MIELRGTKEGKERAAAEELRRIILRDWPEAENPANRIVIFWLLGSYD